MEKIKCTVHIAGKEFSIATVDSEAHVQEVAAWVDRKMKELYQSTKLPGGQLAVLVAMNAADDMIQSREEIRRLRAELADANARIAELQK